VSEMKRAAASLVERRTERFESVHDAGTSKARVEAAFDRARIPRPWPFEMAWSESPVALEITHPPSRAAKVFLNFASIGFVLLVGGSVWALKKSDNEAVRFLLPLATLLLVLAFPFVTLAMASQRGALEARVRKALRAALQDQYEGFPPSQRWADED